MLLIRPDTAPEHWVQCRDEIYNPSAGCLKHLLSNDFYFQTPCIFIINQIIRDQSQLLKLTLHQGLSQSFTDLFILGPNYNYFLLSINTKLS